MASSYFGLCTTAIALRILNAFVYARQLIFERELAEDMDADDGDSRVSVRRALVNLAGPLSISALPSLMDLITRLPCVTSLVRVRPGQTLR